MLQPRLPTDGISSPRSPAASMSNCRGRIFPTSNARQRSMRRCPHSSKWRPDSMDERERYEAGMKVRRAVLGDAHVDRTLANKNPLSEEFQDLITRLAWGEIWTR